MEAGAVSVEFDGIYRNAAVYLNGTSSERVRAAIRAFAFDLTPISISAARTSSPCASTTSAQPNSR